jgi:hypothetical protein
MAIIIPDPMAISLASAQSYSPQFLVAPHKGDATFLPGSLHYAWQTGLAAVVRRATIGGRDRKTTELRIIV